MRLKIGSTWNGGPLLSREDYEIALERFENRIEVVVDAPWFGDPSPQSAPGRTERLWDFEVVEVFLLGIRERYLEIELGPHGHYLVLQLERPRRVVADRINIGYRSRISGTRWSGRATVPLELLPSGLGRINGFAIHGQEDDRRHLAVHPSRGSQPDFHDLSCFGPLEF